MTENVHNFEIVIDVSVVSEFYLNTYDVSFLYLVYSLNAYTTNFQGQFHVRDLFLGKLNSDGDFA